MRIKKTSLQAIGIDEEKRRPAFQLPPQNNTLNSLMKIYHEERWRATFK
jgi:hypothetical protein